MILLLYY